MDKETRQYITCGGEIVQNGEVLCNPRFDYIHVWNDCETINIDMDIDDANKDTEFKDSFINISLSLKDAEVLVLRLKQEIAEVKKAMEEQI